LDANGDSLLHLASHEGNPNFEYLVRNGADVNATNSTGDSIFHTVALFGDCAQAALLLSMGADPLHKNNFGDRPADLCKSTKPDIAFVIGNHIKF
jgi:ankyrin repeat protein